MKTIFTNDHCVIFQSALYQTNTIVIQTPDSILIVDPNWLPDEIEEIKQYINTIQTDRDIYMLVTHSDFDHIIGYGAFSNAKVIASKELAERDDKQDILKQIYDFDQQYYCNRPYPYQYPEVDYIVEKEKEQLSIDSYLSLTIYKAAGHTNDAIMAVAEPYGILVAGDYLSDIECPFIYGSSNQYEETLLKIPGILKKHSCNLAVPGHGTPAKHLKEILARQENSLLYIHSLKQALQEGKTTEETLQLITHYPFYDGLIAEHEKNIVQLRQEWTKK
ncbi:MBL fold metallo-hydrolase [Bacillus sp. 1P06AnD]|uniref:MBL fold metallo-hydrolase n=1 Tax=Bacillus sp. 1P06AnD TaxID=3132208 RepID=UPI0039A01BBF